jgi:hypothetical protein
MRRSIAIGLLGVWLTGCTTPMQPALDSDHTPDTLDTQVAIFERPNTDTVEIDGKEVGPESKIRLPPGLRFIRYRVELFAKSSPPRSGIRVNALVMDTAVLNVVAGHVYRVRASGLFPDYELWIEDATTGQVVHRHVR